MDVEMQGDMEMRRRKILRLYDPGGRSRDSEDEMCVYLVIAVIMACYWSGLVGIGAACGWWPWWMVRATFGLAFAGVLMALCVCSTAGKGNRGRSIG